MDASAFVAWVDRYVQAWESNDPVDIRGLFTSNATYSTSPFAAPWRGHDEIERGWAGRQDAPGSTSFRYEILATAGEVGIVRGWTQYRSPPREYSNIWLVRLDPQGRCQEFIEWWMEKPVK